MNNNQPSIEIVTTQDDDICASFSLQKSFDDGLNISVENQESQTIKGDNLYNCSILLYDNEEKGYYLVNKVEEFEELLRQHEVNTFTKYTIYKTNGTFKGKGKDPKRKPRVHWGVLSKVSPELSTTPYLIVGTRYYVCHLGKCYYTSKLQKYAMQRDQGDHKRYKKVTSSKKVGCPANFKVQRLIVFPDNKISCDTPSERARMGDYIRKNISKVNIQHEYLFRFPHPSDHKSHTQHHMTTVKEPVDKRVADKIKDLVNRGKTSVNLVTDCLEEFVEHELNIDDKNRRRFFPSKIDVRRSIHSAKLKLRKAKNDQEKLEQSRESLGSANEVYFQSSTSDYSLEESKHCSVDNAHTCFPRKTGLLFVYQNSDMKRLYRKYGNHCILLDATYRFCKYSFPLYFVAVQTNVNYQIVAVFITEFETKEYLVDALNVIAHWNPTVIPKYGITDNNMAEVKALQAVFSNIRVFFAPYYRETSWEHRLSSKDMKNVNTAEALIRLRTIANSLTEDETQKAINDFNEWNQLHGSLRLYFDKTWQREIKRWALAYRPLDLLFETNEAVNRLNEEFSYLLLSHMRHWMLSEMVVKLCKHFLPVKYQYYKSLNKSIISRHLKNDIHIPSYLYESPQWFLDYVLGTIIEADKSLVHSYVELICDGHFFLVSKKTNTKYDIKFDMEQKLASCTCSQFMKRKLICKHAMIVGRFYPMWNIEKISSWLFDHPIFRYDRFFVGGAATPTENECEIQLDGEFETVYVESEKEAIETEDDYKNLNINLQKRCKESLTSMKSMLDLMNNDELCKFNQSLKSLCKLWSNKIIKREPAELENEDDIPFPMLQKISDFYADKLVPSNPPTLKRKYKKRKRKLGNHSKTQFLTSTLRKKLKIAKEPAGNELDGFKTCNITTICKVDRTDTNIPIFSIKLEGKEALDPTKALEENKEAIGEYFEEENIVILINNPDEEQI